MLPRNESVNGDGLTGIQRAFEEGKNLSARSIDEIKAEPKASGANDNRPEITDGAEDEDGAEDRQPQGIGDGRVADRLRRGVARRDKIVPRAGAATKAEQPDRKEKNRQRKKERQEGGQGHVKNLLEFGKLGGQA